MPFQTGTFSGLDDLLNKIKLFVTTLNVDPWIVNDDIVTGANQTYKRNLFLKAPGVGGGKNIHLGIQIASKFWLDSTNIPRTSGVESPSWVKYLRIQSYSSYQSGTGFDDQVGRIPSASYTPTVTWEGSEVTCSYWFVADGATLVVYGRVGSLHFGPFYMGFFEPYASSSIYPYPVIVGGTGFGGPNYQFAEFGSHDRHRPFWCPYATDHSLNGASSLQVSSGSWYSLAAKNIWPFGDGENSRNPWWFQRANNNIMNHDRAIQDVTRCIGTLSDKPALWPVQIIKNTGGDAVLGQFKKIKALSWGTNNSEDDVVKINGIDHIIINSTYTAQDRTKLVALELS